MLLLNPATALFCKCELAAVLEVCSSTVSVYLSGVDGYLFVVY